MAASILLVNDDIAAIASVRRLLIRGDFEVTLATSSRDALTAIEHRRPDAVVLAPQLEAGKGAELVAKMRKGSAATTPVVLLGSGIPSMELPVVPLPLDGKALLDALSTAIAPKPAAKAEPQPESKPEVNAAPDPEPAAEPWNWFDAGQTLFEATHREIEAEAIASIDATLDKDKNGDRHLFSESPPPRSAAVHPFAGACASGDLARIVVHLSSAGEAARLEVETSDATRTLWFDGGALVGATSTLPSESLLDRARRDGLLDARQEVEVRALRGADPAELLERLRARGFVRDAEVIPLVQRYTEQIALEALTEPECTARIAPGERPEKTVPRAVSPRAPVQLVLEALRRSTDGAALLARWGGLGAVPALRTTALDLDALALPEREARLIAQLDGESSIEDLLLGAGLRQEPALRLLGAFEALGWVEVRRPSREESAAEPAASIDVDRLESKYREIQDADYFTILGLERGAGGEEVTRAWSNLAAEFDPLKYAGHPDATVVHRARQVHDALAEAARVLANESLRAGYARCLVD